MLVPDGIIVAFFGSYITGATWFLSRLHNKVEGNEKKLATLHESMRSFTNLVRSHLWARRSTIKRELREVTEEREKAGLEATQRELEEVQFYFDSMRNEVFGDGVKMRQFPGRT